MDCGGNMKISDNIYWLDSAKGKRAGNIYLVVDDEITLIDTGFPGSWEKVTNDMLSIGIQARQVKNILLTHYDIDHMGNASKLQELTNAELWASKEDIPVIQGKEDRKGFKRFFKYLFHVEPPKNINILVPGRTFNNIKVLFTPGHTPGHLCFMYKKYLFAGDLLENKNGALLPYPSMWNWDNSLVRASLQEISKYDIETVCPGHGNPVAWSTFKTSK